MKLNRMVGYQSLIERDFIYLLDFAPTITEYREQPFPIYYKEAGKQRQYTPDFFCVHAGQKYLIECKHHDYLQLNRNRKKWEAARRWGQAQGVIFCVVTEEMIRAGCCLENIKLLTDYARYPLNPAVKTRVLQLLLTTPTPVTIGELMTLLSPEQPQQALTIILHLAYHQFLHVSVTEMPITPASLIELNQEPATQQILPTVLFA